MGSMLQAVLVTRDTLIFLLQHLVFLIKFKKSVLHPVKQVQFLGLMIDTKKMNLPFSDKKSKHVS